MFDNLREEGKDLPLFQEGPPPGIKVTRRFQVPERVLGLNAPQRFIVSVLIFLITTLLGALVLLVTGKIVPF